MDRLEGAVAGELVRFGTTPGLAAVVDAWPQAVGSAIARNAWPARLTRDGRLVVHTSSAAWAFELGQLEPRIRSLLPEPRPPKLRFVVGPLPEPTPEPRQVSDRKAVEPSPAAREAAAALVASIADENLRKIVAKAAALSLARGASDRSLW
jgi:predicted nucleic acid-binding Zn ribbon protein